MSVEHLIPEIYAKAVMRGLEKQLVFGQRAVINRDYEGEIKSRGDTVRIRQIGTITIGDYVKNTDINPPEEIDDGELTLTIERAKYFNFQLDDVDDAQADVDALAPALEEAGYQLSDVCDQYIASKYTDAGNTIGTNTTPIAIDDTNAYQTLVDAGTALDKKNVPKQGRWAVLPPDWIAALRKQNLIVSVSESGDDETLRNGLVTRLAGFDIYESNNVAVVQTDKYKVLFGHPMAWTFAEQVRKVERYRVERRFATGVKGLHLYGAKVTRPNALCVVTATF